MMPMIRCNQGHFFDDQKHSSCPWCGVSDLNLDLGGGQTLASDAPKTVAFAQEPMAEELATLKTNQGRVAGMPAEGATVALSRKRFGMDPVVGWLVCVSGPERGRDYRIHSEKNAIGRSDAMDIVVKGDQSISRENHAHIVFNPKKRVFRIQSGDARGLVYVNEEEVVTMCELNPHDFIEIGESKFCFVPFCGEHFCWGEEKVIERTE